MSQLGFLAELFDALPVGVIVLDADGRVRHFNRYEERLAQRDREDVLDRVFFEEVAPCMKVGGLAEPFFAGLAAGELSYETEFTFPLPFLDQPRDVRLQMRDFEHAGRRFGAIVVEDITTRRALDRMRDTLSSLVVHDLKNPLGAMLANLQFLEDVPAVQEDELASECVGDGLSAGRRLSRMLLNLLDISRLETQEVPLAPAVTDLCALLEAAARGNRAAARMRGVRIETELPSDAVDWVCDGAIIRRAVDNLVDNALRFAPEGTAVTLRLEASEQAVVEVCDHGPGVPPEAREAVFDRYNQAAHGDGHNRGLGLTFVQLAMRAHGGDVGVRCPPSGGTVFRLRLPSRG